LPEGRARRAGLLAANMGIRPELVGIALDRMGYGVAPLTPEVVADQQKIADTFHLLGLIPAAIDVSSAVWRPIS
jgi:sulfonate transport system substrate-binding protein